MSEQHAKRLSKLRAAYFAALEALDYAASPDSGRDWKSDLKDFQRAYENSEKTYYIWVCAEVEGMMYRHLADHFPTLGMLPTAAADELLESTRFHLNPRSVRQLETSILTNARRVYAYRNRLAHGEKTRQERVSIIQAIDWLTDLVQNFAPMN